jgi:hypothetical protein
VIEWLEVLGPIVVSWPVVGLTALLMLRRPLKSLLIQLSEGDIRKAKVGPFEVERELRRVAAKGEEAVGQLQRLNQLMAESRLLELEITEANFGPVFTSEQRDRMQRQIAEFRELTESQL